MKVFQVLHAGTVVFESTDELAADRYAWLERQGGKKAVVKTVVTRKRKNPETVEKTMQGYIVVSDIINGYRVQKKYQGYTRREAITDFRKVNRKKKNPLIRDSFGKVVSRSRNLAGVHRYAAKVQADKVTIAKLSNGGGRIWIHFVNGSEFIEDFASYTVMLGHIATWRALQGVKLEYAGGTKMGPIAPGNANLITHMTKGRLRRRF